MPRLYPLRERQVGAFGPRQAYGPTRNPLLHTSHQAETHFDETARGGSICPEVGARLVRARAWTSVSAMATPRQEPRPYRRNQTDAQPTRLVENLSGVWSGARRSA